MGEPENDPRRFNLESDRHRPKMGKVASLRSECDERHYVIEMCDTSHKAVSGKCTSCDHTASEHWFGFDCFASRTERAWAADAGDNPRDPRASSSRR